MLRAFLLNHKTGRPLLHHLYCPFHALFSVALREEELSVAIELVFAGLARNKHRYVRPRHLRVVLHARIRLVNDEAVGYYQRFVLEDQLNRQAHLHDYMVGLEVIAAPRHLDPLHAL